MRGCTRRCTGLASPPVGRLRGRCLETNTRCPQPRERSTSPPPPGVGNPPTGAHGPACGVGRRPRGAGPSISCPSFSWRPLKTRVTVADVASRDPKKPLIPLFFGKCALRFRTSSPISSVAVEAPVGRVVSEGGAGARDTRGNREGARAMPTATARRRWSDWASRTWQRGEACGGRPERGGEWAAKAVKRPPQQPAQPPVRQLLGAADAQTAHPAASSTAPAHQLLGSANAETTPAGAPAAAADRTQRPDATCEGTNG